MSHTEYENVRPIDESAEETWRNIHSKPLAGISTKIIFHYGRACDQKPVSQNGLTIISTEPLTLIVGGRYRSRSSTPIPAEYKWPTTDGDRLGSDRRRCSEMIAVFPCVLVIL